MLDHMMTLFMNEDYLTMDAAVASDGMHTLDLQITKPSNNQIPGVCVQVFKFSSQVWALMFGDSGSVFRFVFGYSHSVSYSGSHVRYSHSGIQVQN